MDGDGDRGDEQGCSISAAPKTQTVVRSTGGQARAIRRIYQPGRVISVAATPSTSVRAVLAGADAEDKAEVYRQLSLELTYMPEDALVMAK